MSDNSTGSSGSSSNSWTLLSPEEAAIDTPGPVDDGTESIGDAPSLSEEVAASSLDVKSSGSEIPLETILSEEGQQICQETSPDFFDEGTASGLAAVEADPEICAPVIHDTITSSPPDNDLLGAVPFTIATESALLLSEEPTLEEPYGETFPDVQAYGETFPDVQAYGETFPDVQHTFELPSKECPAPEPTPEITTTSEPREISPSPEVPEAPSLGVSAGLISNVTAVPVVDINIEAVPVVDINIEAVPVVDINIEAVPGPENSSPGLLSEVDFASVAESPQPESHYTETITSSALDKEEEEYEIQDEDLKPADELMDVMRETEPAGVDVSVNTPVNTPAEEGGLRFRHVSHTEVERQSSDENEEEEDKFKLPERKVEKAGFSLNHLIGGALVLLCLGSLFFSEDFDGSDISDQELLEKLAQENKQISILEAEIQSQKEELHKALKLAADKGTTDEENARMKEELSALPGLKQELETLKARVTELTQLTADEASAPSASSVPSSPGAPVDGEGSSGPETRWDKKQELKRQRTLLEESRKRLEGMKKQGWHKKGLRESLVEMQQRLSQQVDHLGKRDERRRNHKHKEGKKEWGEKKSNHWKMEDTGKKKEWMPSKDKYDGDRRPKDHFRKSQEEWDYKKGERRLERERRKQERPWQIKLDHHKQHHLHHESVGFWKLQEEKLKRNQKPPKRCQGVANCADAEGLIPVQLSEFQALLEHYLSKLEGVSEENIEALHRLVARFFQGGIFTHDGMLFSEFVEDVADILEDLADVLKDEQQGSDDDVLEEQMEEFEREALWKFAASFG